MKKLCFKRLQNVRNGMSIEKRSQSPPINFKQQIKETPRPQLVVCNGQTIRYHFLAQTPMPVKAGQTQDKTLLWKCKLPTQTQYPKLRKKLVVFKEVQYVIYGWAGDRFPSVIYLLIDGVIGYLAKDGLVTTRIAALQLVDMNPMLDQSGVKTSDLKYVLKNSVNWQLPINQTDLKLRVSIDQTITPLQLPLPNPISLNCQIRLQV